ncbi:MAG TPA: hypothetical protein VGS58_22555, partial [Candidatus Sulfopaludibacter sp.]|nr:hypothetical protein [Candidatus Sulfopaludibacter sp.]
FRGSLGQMFPRGYRVAIPERSCGFAWSAQLAGEEMKSLQQTIDNCYRRGTRPFVPGSYDPDDLLPAERRNPSFAPQGDGRVQAGGAPGGYVSRQQSDHR